MCSFTLPARLFFFLTLLRPLTMMSIRNAYKPIITVPATSRLLSIRHTKPSSTVKLKEKSEQYEINRQLRLCTDPEYRKRYNEQTRAATERYIKSPGTRARYREMMKFHNHVKGPSLGPMGYPWKLWLRKCAWVRDELDWRSHVPVYSAVRMERNCERCNYPPPNGSMLWWVRT